MHLKIGSAKPFLQSTQSPPKDNIERPGTPDTSLECNLSPYSVSVSDDPSHTLELDQEGTEDGTHSTGVENHENGGEFDSCPFDLRGYLKLGERDHLTCQVIGCHTKCGLIS